MTSTTKTRQRWIVARTRKGDGAPSLSLSFDALTPNLALIAFLERYGQQPDETRVDVRMPGNSRHEVTATYVRTQQLWQQITPGDPLLAAAQDFEAAAAILAHKCNAPVHVLADLLDEADWLRNRDRRAQLDIGTAEGAEQRYADTTRASRRQTVCKWINALKQGQPTTAQAAALTFIGGIGS